MHDPSNFRGVLLVCWRRLDLNPRKFVFCTDPHSIIEQVYNMPYRANMDTMNLKSQPVNLDPGCSFIYIYIYVFQGRLL